MHPQRWIGHADVDEDGHHDDRCCADDSSLTCDDCNDNDPRRWTGHTDLDGDGHHDSRCRCDPHALGLAFCETYDDCDDDCETCYPGGEQIPGDALDHNCDAIVDDLGRDAAAPSSPEIVGSIDTGDSRVVAVVGSRGFVGSIDGLREIDLTVPESPEIVSFLDTGAVTDVAIWGDLVLVTTAEGLTVVRRRLPDESAPELILLAGPVDTGYSRAVHVAGGLAYVASYTGVHIVDLSSPEWPAIVETIGEPVIHDVSDVLTVDYGYYDMDLYVVSRFSSVLPGEGGITSFNKFQEPSWEAGSGYPARGANHIEPGCGRLVLTTDTAVKTLRGALEEEHTLEIDGINAVALPCAESGPYTYAYIATDDGLVCRPFPYAEEDDIDRVDTGRSRDVDVTNNHAFVATEQGLHIVRLNGAQ